MLSGASSHSTSLSVSVRSLSGILVVMRNQADVNDPDAGLEKYQAANLFNGLTRLSFSIDGTQFPRRSINCSQGVELYEALLEFSGKRRGNAYNANSFFDATYDTATDGQFVIGYPFNALTGSNFTASGIDYSTRTSQLIVNFESLTASANTQIDIWLRYDRILNIGANGDVRAL